MEGGELHVAGVFMPHLVKHFLKGVECAVWRVHIVLVHLQGRQDTLDESSWKAESSQQSTPKRAERVNQLRGGGGGRSQSPALNKPASSTSNTISTDKPEFA